MNADKRKQLKNDYRNKPAVGAVYAIGCGGDPRRMIKSTTDIAGIQNRFQFAQATNTCPDPAFRGEWEKYGAEAFSFEVLEALEMKKDQTADEFADDIRLLHALWLEKLAHRE